MHLKISSAKWRPFCSGGDELSHPMAFVIAGPNTCGMMIVDVPYMQHGKSDGHKYVK